MFSYSKTTVVAISASFIAVASALTVNTPASLVQCQPALLSWGDGVAPYYLAIIPGGQPSAAALINLPNQSGNTYTWTVNLNAGQEVTVKITDSTGAINYSDKVPIQAGTSNSCMTGGAASGGSSAAAAPAAGSSATAATSAARAPLSTTASGFTPVVASSSSSANNAAAAAATSSKPTASVTSGVNANANAATTPSAAATSSKPNSASHIKAGTGLLLGAFLLALVA